MADLHQRVGLESATLEPMDHAGLRVLRRPAHLPPGISEKSQRPRRSNGRIFLTQRARSRIARVGEDGVAGCLLSFVEREKGVLGHVDLATHLADIGYVATPEFFWNVLEGSDVCGDVLALGAVAPRGRGDEFATLITERHREPIDFGLGAEI